MIPPNIPPETINQIQGQLNAHGDPEELGKGYTYQNGIQGQIEVPTEPGNRYLKNQLMSYQAEVIEKEGKLEWEIKSIVSL